MTQADGRNGNTNKRIVLHFSDSNGNFNDNLNDIYRFSINPQNYTWEMPQRTTLLKTKSDIIIEDFGKEIETISFSGTTGFKSVYINGKYRTGQERMEQLKAMLTTFANSSGGSGNTPAQMKLYNRTDEVYKLVTLAPQGFKIIRDAEKPLLYNYELVLYVIGEAWENGDNAKVDPELGNRNPSTSQSSTLRYLESSSEVKKEMDKNGQILDANNTRFQEHLNNVDRNSTSKNAGKIIYNPNINTNGVMDAVDDTAMRIGYANGGAR